MKPSKLLPLLAMCLLFYASSPVQAVGNPLYVIAKSGLNLRKSADPKSEVIGKIPYGGAVEVIDGGKMNMNIEGLEGGMAKVKYGTQVGYAFSGFMIRYPAPNPDHEVWQYVKLAREKGIALPYIETRHNYYSEKGTDMKDWFFEYNEYQLQLEKAAPAEAFLLAKAMFAIPDKMQFPGLEGPAEARQENPDKSPYVYDESLTTVRKNGKLQKMTYYKGGEGGAKTVVIKYESNLWQIVVSYHAD